jgi:hypothetical protein
MDRAYRIDAAIVVSDIIDGEAVMLHRESGDYFSADGTGCLIWQWIGEGHGRARMLGELAARFAAEPDELAAAFDGFMAELALHRLVREQDAAGAGDTASAAPAAEKVAFTRPVLNVYSDIRNLLLLDPIHDVAQDTGWPAPKRIDPAG